MTFGLVAVLVLALGAACDDDFFGGGGGDPDSGSGGSDDAGGGGSEDGGGTVEVPTRIEQYIRSDAARRMVLEVDSVPGTEPPEAVQRRIVETMMMILDKPDGVEVILDGAVTSRGADHAWTDEELVTLARDTLDLDAGPDAVVMHAVFVDGRYARDEGGRVTLGLAYDHTNLIIFRERIENACSRASIGPLLRDRLCEDALVTVLVHEIGHVIGLVDRGLPMVTDHKDEEHGAHDSDSSCVMYWVAETGNVIDVIAERLIAGGDGELLFGEQCLADIAAVRDR